MKKIICREDFWELFPNCKIGIVVCSIALVLNAVSAYLMYPAVLEALESGDYGNLAPGTDLCTTPKGNSTWG